MLPLVDPVPSAYALKLRPYVKAVVLFQFLLLPGRFLEIWGGICFLLVCGLGYAVVWTQPPMSPKWVMCWGTLCFVNAILDSMFGCFKLAALYKMHAAHSDGNPLHGDKDLGLGQLPAWILWWVCLTLVLVPISEGLGAFLSYKLYKDCSANHGYDPFAQPFLGEGPLAQQQGPVGPTQYATFNYNQPQTHSNFTPFSGTGQHLSN